MQNAALVEYDTSRPQESELITEVAAAALDPLSQNTVPLFYAGCKAILCCKQCKTAGTVLCRGNRWSPSNHHARHNIPWHGKKSNTPTRAGEMFYGYQILLDSPSCFHERHWETPGCCSWFSATEPNRTRLHAALFDRLRLAQTSSENNTRELYTANLCSFF